jgi:hypothetical protein
MHRVALIKDFADLSAVSIRARDKLFAAANYVD